VLAAEIHASTDEISHNASGVTMSGCLSHPFFDLSRLMISGTPKNTNLDNRAIVIAGEASVRFPVIL